MPENIDKEILQTFIDESIEHLEGIENDLLAIEEQGTSTDQELINKVFRAIHSIKGASGFFGLTKISDLSHGMENILNKIRNKELPPTSQIINVLLSSVDTLSSMINKPEESNNVDISEDLILLKGAETGAASESAQAEAAAQSDTEKAAAPISQEAAAPATEGMEPCADIPFSIAADDLTKVEDEGKMLYTIKYDLIKETVDKGIGLLDFIMNLQKVGTLIDTYIDFSLVGTLDADLDSITISLTVLLATVLEVDFMVGSIVTSEDQVIQITKEMLGDAPAAEAPEKEEKKKEEKTEKESSRMPPTSTSDAIHQPEKETQEKEKKEQKGDIVADLKKQLTASTSLRISVKLLDALMTLTGELVLARNQLVQSLSVNDTLLIENSTKAINLIISELQETVMATRMQPLSIVFNKYKRIVHDLAKASGKKINLLIEGESVELDKTIIENIADPLTHLVRNAADHGIEIPSQRARNGKDEAGTLKLHAFHEAGQVIIRISDDGGGIDHNHIKDTALKKGLFPKEQLEKMTKEELVNIIFMPGFSTAEKVTDLSGRGVGMDVVSSNFSKLGGVVDISTSIGKGTTFTIKLPLTLAIISSLLTSVADSRYIIPQVNLLELIRVPPDQVKSRIEKIEDVHVIRLRERLLPLVRLSDVLDVKSIYRDPETGEVLDDRRYNIHDRRGSKEDVSADDNKRATPDRRKNFDSACNIVVVNAGDIQYGLIVDTILDSEEIVVKPLGYHLSECKGLYAGATILGDGRAALILDVVNLCRQLNLGITNSMAKQKMIQKEKELERDAKLLLVVKNAPNEQFAFPLSLISRVEKVNKKDIEITAGKRDIKYRDESILLFKIEDVANVAPIDDEKETFMIVFNMGKRTSGIMFSHLIDIADIDIEIDESTFQQPGILGSAIIYDKTTLLVDLYGIVNAKLEEWGIRTEAPAEGAQHLILLVEDSNFFRKNIKAFIAEEGFNVITANDGVEGLEMLEKHKDSISLIITDIEMPRMDGFEMTRRIREELHMLSIPIIAVTALAGESAEKKGFEAGITDYQIKLDRDRVLASIRKYLSEVKK
ncbi:chemotaxis protein CheW [Spirochaetota bacterium]